MKISIAQGKPQASAFVSVNQIHHGRSETVMKGITPDSVALSFWSPPYFVGKDYEKHETYGSWQAMLQAVIHEHFRVLKPGGFMVINIADIRCFKDESLPRFHAMNVSMQSSKISREMVLEAQALNPSFNRPRVSGFWVARQFGCEVRPGR